MAINRMHEHSCDCERCLPDPPTCDYCGRALNEADESDNDDCEVNAGEPEEEECDQ